MDICESRMKVWSQTISCLLSQVELEGSRTVFVALRPLELSDEVKCYGTATS